MTTTLHSRNLLVAHRLDQYISGLRSFGLNPGGGITRPVYGQAWQGARDQVVEWMRQIGLTTVQDAVGNVFGRLAGTEPGASTIMTGSHIDTVPDGGAFDGALGIHAGLVALEVLKATYGPPRRPVEVVAICEEESSRYLAGYWGSRAINGLIGPADASTLTDAEGVVMADAMRRAGLDPVHIPSAARHDIGAFLELHIEKGPLLEENGLDLGIVHTITGQRRAVVRVHGQADHAGTAPMDLRRDAAAGASAMHVLIHDLATRLGRPAVATVGRVDVQPGAPNVVPSLVEFSIDVRHPDRTIFGSMCDEIEGIVTSVAAQADLEAEFTVAFEIAPQPMDDDMCARLHRAAADLGQPALEMTSGAGHDSQLMARHVPTAMIFVPSPNGTSHSPREFTPTDRILPGVHVLIEALHDIAY